MKAFLLTLGAVLAGLASTLLVSAELLTTGNDDLDQWRYWVVLYGAMNGIFSISSLRAIMGIIHMESLGQVALSVGDNGPTGYSSDPYIPRGPSIGPMHILRARAAQLGFWHPEKWSGYQSTSCVPSSDALSVALTNDSDDRQEYLQLGQDPDSQTMLLGWGIGAFADALSRANNNVGQGLANYNGCGSAAVQYSTQIQQWLSATYGSNW